MDVDARQPDDSGLNRVAITVGWAVDLVGTVVSMFGALFLYAFAAAASSPGSFRAEDLGMSFSGTPFLLAGFVVGLAWVVAGGYVAGRMAGRRFLRHAGWVGALSTLVGVLMSVIPGEDDGSLPLWYESVSILLTTPAALAGGWLADQHAARRLKAVAGRGRPEEA